jgi:HK97 family phage portal protein
LRVRSFFSFARQGLSHFLQESRSSSIEDPKTPLSAVFDEPKTTAGIVVNEQKSLGISTVYACVKVIAETMALMDLEVVKTIGKSKVPDIYHPVYRLISREPSALYNRFEFIESMMAWVLLWGNAYAWIKRNRYGEPLELLILPEYEVTPKLTERGRLFYEWRSVKGTQIIQPDNMLHFKNLGTDGLCGTSPIAIQRENLATAIAKQQQDGAFYANGAKASGVLMTPGTMGVKERGNLESSFDKATNGARNRFKTIILEEGVKYQQLTIPQNDAQFIQSKKFERSEIAGWFRVPLHLIQDLERATFSNISDQDRAFAKYTINPWAQRLQQEIDRKLFFEEERGVFSSQFNLDDIIKGDIKTRYEVHKIGVESGFLKPIEAREAEGWGTEDAQDIDGFFMNAAMKPVKQILLDPSNQPAK